MGRNRRDVAERLHETLTGAGAPLLGVIANGFKARRNAPYSYAYDYSQAKAEPPKVEPPSTDGVALPNGVAPTGQPSAEEPVPSTQS